MIINETWSAACTPIPRGRFGAPVVNYTLHWCSTTTFEGVCSERLVKEAYTAVHSHCSIGVIGTIRWAELSRSLWIPTYKTRTNNQKMEKLFYKTKEIRQNKGDRNSSSRKGSKPLTCFNNKIIYMMFIDTIWSWFDAPVWGSKILPPGEEVTETTEETSEAVEEATAETADSAVAWARGASSRQDGQDRWQGGRFDNGQGRWDASSCTVAITASQARSVKASAYSGGHCG